MTDREKAIVMAYTGYCMLAGDKLSIFYEYVESIMGRPVYTHEMGTKVVDNIIREKARPDFIALCADEDCSEKQIYTKNEVIAILTELQQKIEEDVLADDPNTLLPFLQARETCVAVIQQKIKEVDE